LPIVGVLGGKDAPFLGAVVVGVLAVVVGVVNAEAPVAEFPKWTLLLWMVGVCLVALEAVGEGGGLTALMLAQCNALAALLIIIIVLWSFSSDETREGRCRRGCGAAFVQMGNEAGVDGSMSKVAVGIDELAIDLVFVIIDGGFLMLAAVQLVNVGVEPVDISNNSRVFEVSESLVDECASGMGGMEQVVVHVFQTWVIEVGGRKWLHMEWKGINNTTFSTSAHKVHLISNGLVGDVLGGLCLTKLIYENEWVVPKVSCIKLLPAFTRVVKVSGEGKGVVA
jgi:hypothetical protein